MEQEENKKQHPLTALVFLEVGLFEIAFVIVGVLLIFGTLNYFNILPFSQTFPKFLGWLPRQEIPSNTSQKEVPSGTLPPPTPFERFSYDTVTAQKALEVYIKDNIKQEFLPAKIDIQENLISSGKKDGTDYEFGANWTLQDIIFNATFHYIPKTNEFRDMEFYAIPPNPINTPIDSTNSTILVNTYLKNIPTPITFDCGTFQKNTAFCEHFTDGNTGKRGFGIVESNDETNKKIILVFGCFIPKNDTYYTKRTSCLLFREKYPSGL